MASKRVCAYRHSDGRPCGAPPLLDGLYCLFHDPEHAEAVAEARRVAGQRRRKEATVATIYDVFDVTSDEGTKRLMQIAVTDLLAMESSLPRAKAIISAVQAGIKVREAGDVAARLEKLEAIHNHHGPEQSVFEEHDDLEETG